MASYQFVEYDGFWHVFIARQDTWKTFWWDYSTNDHPLLFFLLLKLVMRLGRSVLIYRSISVASGIGSVWLIGKIMQRLCASRWVPLLTALAFGLSMPLLEIAISVRSYMLAVFFVLLSFYYLLDLPPLGRDTGAKTRLWFALAAMLAVSSHYYAFFYVVACGIVLAGYTLVRAPRQGRLWLGHVLTFLPILAVMAYFYFSHLSANLTNLNHVTDFLYSRPEPKGKFVLRNLHSLFNFFSPWRIPDRRVFEKVAAVLAVAAIALTRFARSRLPLLFSLLILFELAVAGILAVYPFGGFLRQQFLLFPFFLLTAGVCLDGFLAARSPRFAAAVAAAAVLVILSVSGYRFYRFPKFPDELYARQMAAFNTSFPSASDIYIDQVSLITFFTFHHQWDWHYTRTLPMATPVDEYVVARGPDRVHLFRDKQRWNLDFLEPRLYQDLTQSMRAAGLHTLDVFCLNVDESQRTPAEQQAYQRQVYAAAAAQHVQILRFVPFGRTVFAEFAPEGPPANALNRPLP